MITLITGAPGAGKTAALVQLLDRFAKEGRAIFVDGIPDLQIAHVELTEPRKWHTEVPDGSVIVIDEVQRIWRPAGTGSAVPADVEALETHRHKGIEFYLITQHPNLLHANVRRLVGRHIHLRDVGVLGRWWYEWPEATNPESWRTAPIKQRYKLPRGVFGKYKSASLHVKPVRKIPTALWVVLGAGLVVAFLGTRVYARFQEITAPPGTQPDKLSQAGAAVPVPVSLPRTVPEASRSEDAAPAEPARPELVGCISMGPRCECISSEGKSVEVELKLCLQSSQRGGTGVPYLLKYPAGQPRHLPASPQPDDLGTPALRTHVGKPPQGAEGVPAPRADAVRLTTQRAL